MKTCKLTALLLCICMLLLCAPAAAAAGIIEEDRSVSLSITSQYGDIPLVGAPFSIYPIAQVDERGELTSLEPYTSFDVEIRGKNDGVWIAMTSVLEAYVLEQEIEPYAAGTTDAEGKLRFPVDHETLEKGLYLVLGGQHFQGGNTYETIPFLVMLPAMDPVENIWNYDVCVSAKHTMTPGETVSHTVQKIWNDTGNENNRPGYITVSLLQNGDVYDTVRLYPPYWAHTWENLDPDSVWTVYEHKIVGYVPQIRQEDDVFLITNTYTPELPKTGQLDWPVPVLAVLGLCMIVAGWALRRSGKKEQYEN